MPSTLCPSFWANSVLKLICLVVGCDKFTTNPFFTSKYSSYMFQIFDQDRILIQCHVISWSWPHFSWPKIEGEVSPHKLCVLFSGVCQQWQCVKIVSVLFSSDLPFLYIVAVQCSTSCRWAILPCTIHKLAVNSVPSVTHTECSMNYEATWRSYQ
jgi:hypothetical protein